MCLKNKYIEIFQALITSTRLSVSGLHNIRPAERLWVSLMAAPLLGCYFLIYPYTFADFQILIGATFGLRWILDEEIIHLYI